jgi:thioredoxin reductase (NADPH)
LSVIVLDAVAFGGQAGESARIENYLGFPTGIPGRKLTARAFVQAQKFGAVMVIPAEAVGLDCSHVPYGIHLADGRQVKGSTVVVASGAHYRRPEIPHLRDFEGRGVWYWASPIEARLCRSEEVALVGAGNSAGQAAVFLADVAAKVWMLVRGPSLAESMSQYLIDRIEAAENIEVLTETEITDLSGSPQGQLERVRWRNRVPGEETVKPIRNVFIFIGADPATGWLESCGVSLDAKGFVRTGAALPTATMMDDNDLRRPLPLEAEIANVFAVGDVRAGSVKRVGAAIGEGAAAVAQIHTVLSEATAPPSVARRRRARSR